MVEGGITMQNTPATSSTAPRIRQAVRTANAKTAPPALPRAPLLHGLNRAVLWQLAACGTGLLLSAGQVYGGAAPFGLGLLLGCGNTYAPAAALGCLAGLLLFQPLDTALKLAGACIGALTARIVGRQLGQTGFLPGAACGVGVLLLEQGLVTLVGGASPADTASLLCSAALAVLVGLGIHKLHIGTPRGACLWAAMAAACLQRAALPGQLSTCVHPADLCATVSHGYRLWCSRRQTRARAELLRTALTEQYSAMATALAQMAARLGRAGLPDPRREARTTQLFASLGLEPLECTVLTDLAGRVTAAVTLPRTSFTPGECRALAEEMGRICRRDFDPPEVTNCRTVTILHFGERPLYRAVFGLASRPAPPETVSGDACRQFCDSAGRAQMLLCDGMGTGKPAAVDGQMAAKLTAQLLQAGFAAESAARLVNVALGLKNAGQESGATLDLLTLDLYTGRAGLFKAGAAPSFLCRAGVVRTLDGASLPMGVLPTVTGRSTALTLDVGDTVMMVSDGALCDGSAWLCDQLTLSTRLGQSPQQTAEAVAASAVRRSGARQDDITVAIVRLERQKS